jgi:molecular chaperone GrpE
LPDEDPIGGPGGPDPAGGPTDASSEPTGPSASAPQPDTSGLANALETPEAGAAEAYHRRARLAEDRLTEVLDAYRKLRTDNDGFRERTAKNIERRFDGRRERLLLKFIDILDNLDRALEAAEQSYAGQPLIEGLILVRTQLLQTLQDEGLERIPALGLPYDPSVSEAVELRPVDDPDHHNLVVQEALRGYRLNGRIARASRVVVGQFHGEPVAPPSAHPDPPPVEDKAPDAAAGGEPSLEDIVSRAEAQEALFPNAFEPLPDDDEPE